MMTGAHAHFVFLRSIFVKGHEYLAVVENRWEEGRTRQRIHLYLGRADRLDRDQLAANLRRLGITIAGKDSDKVFTRATEPPGVPGEN